MQDVCILRNVTSLTSSDDPRKEARTKLNPWKMLRREPLQPRSSVTYTTIQENVVGVGHHHGYFRVSESKLDDLTQPESILNPVSESERIETFHCFSRSPFKAAQRLGYQRPFCNFGSSDKSMLKRITIIFPDTNHHKFIALRESVKLIHRCDRRPNIYIVE